MSIEYTKAFVLCSFNVTNAKIKREGLKHKNKSVTYLCTTSQYRVGP